MWPDVCLSKGFPLNPVKHWWRLPLCPTSWFSQESPLISPHKCCLWQFLGSTTKICRYFPTSPAAHLELPPKTSSYIKVICFCGRFVLFVMSHSALSGASSHIQPWIKPTMVKRNQVLYMLCEQNHSSIEWRAHFHSSSLIAFFVRVSTEVIFVVTALAFILFKPR